MSTKLERLLKEEKLSKIDRKALETDKETLDLLHSVSTLSRSEGGKALKKEVKERCREVLMRLILNTEDASEAKLRSLVAEFGANFNLFNTLLSAPADYKEARENLEENLDDLLEG